MYRQYGDIKVCMYNIYGTNQSTCIFTTKWFSRPNSFHNYHVSECTGNLFHNILLFKKCAIRVAQYKQLFMKPKLPFQPHVLVNKTCIAILDVSMTLTVYRAYFCVHDHYSAKINKTRRLIMTTNQKGPQNEKTFSQPKVPAKVVKFIFDHCVNYHSSANKN